MRLAEVQDSASRIQLLKCLAGHGHLRAAFGAELRRAFGLVAATRAGQSWRRGRRSALGAEFRLAHFGSARHARRRGCGLLLLGGSRGLDGGVGAHVNARRVVGCLRLLVELRARGVSLRLRVRRGQLLLEVGRAALALPGCRVPADFGADPSAAARALVEVRLSLLDRPLQSLVVRLASDGALNLVGGVPGVAEPAAEHVARRAQKRPRGSRYRRLEARHVAVAALVAVELELVALVRRKVVIIIDELNHPHCAKPPEALTSERVTVTSRRTRRAALPARAACEKIAGRFLLVTRRSSLVSAFAFCLLPESFHLFERRRAEVATARAKAALDVPEASAEFAVGQL